VFYYAFVVSSDNEMFEPQVQITGATMARVVIVEDQRLVGEFFQLHCRAMGHEVLGVYATLGEGVAAVETLRPDLLLLDFSLPDGNGLEAGRKFRQAMPRMKILGISAHHDDWTMMQVQRFGLHGFLDKQGQNPGVLTDAINAVLSGQIYYVPAVQAGTSSLRRDPNAFNRILSDYELQILSLIGESLSDDEIAVRLEISASTMQSRRRDIMRKLDVHSTPKLIRFALENGLTRPDQLVKRK
jgi:DNA-binding NarL/FixJ family response regulator